MKTIIGTLAVLLFLTAILCGCGENAPTPDSHPSGTGTTATLAVDFSKTDEDMFTDRDQNTSYNEKTAVTVTFDGDKVSVDGNGVLVTDNLVTLTAEKTYLFKGNWNNGTVLVDAADTAKIQLVFDGVSIHSETAAALYIKTADKVFITLGKGTENTLSNGGTFTQIDENNQDATLFSKQDLTLNGEGTLTVTSPSGHGITVKDDLVMTGGDYVVTAASHGLEVNDSVAIGGKTTLSLTTGKDGIHAKHDEDPTLGFVYLSGGTLTITAEGDGISAGSYLHLCGGDITVTAGGGSENGDKASSDNWGDFLGGGMRPGGMDGGMGGRPRSFENDLTATDTTEESTSMKGMKAESDLLIQSGTIRINAADDAIHSDTSLLISGGTIEVASGDDAVHAEERLTVTGGKLIVTESYEGLEALHVDVQGGEISLVCSDDGINAAGGVDASGMEGGRDGMFGGGMRPGGMGGSSNGSVTVSGGTLSIQSSGDGIDANGTLAISGGHITVFGPTQGDTATLDYDVSATITGGTFIGTGASGMAQTFSQSSQGVLAVRVENSQAGTEIIIKNAKGEEVLRYQPKLSFQVVIFSSPDVIAGEEYTLSVGSLSGTITAD